jgi:hypothetical protein
VEERALGVRVADVGFVAEAIAQPRTDARQAEVEQRVGEAPEEPRDRPGRPPEGGRGRR